MVSKFKIIWLPVVVLALLFTLSGVAAPATAQHAAPDSPAVNALQGDTLRPWWNDRVFYEIFVRSFYDSDGDGIGDLQGVIEKLDYLNDGDPDTTDDLGVTGIWLMPVMESPSYHGYDVTDYFAIEEDYGTMDDFRELMAAAHERGIVVIVDMVLNHTSSVHPWFLEARQNNPDYENWYLWAETQPRYRGPWGQEVWHQAGERYYYAVFWSGMPDLNYANPDVTDRMFDIVQFWIEDIGVDGFRLDAIKHLIEDGAVQENTRATLSWLSGFYDYVKYLDADFFTVGEVWSSTREIAPYVDDRVDVAFEFDMAEAILQSVRRGRSGPLRLAMSTILRTYPPGQYAVFLSNHDQNRVMSQLRGDIPEAKLAATLLLTQPGVPFIYYGEEIGMEGMKPDERIRTPMQWDDSDTAGFTTADTPWEPLADGYEQYTVAGQTDDPESLLSHYRTLIHLRNQEPALRQGEMQPIESSTQSVYAFLRYGKEEAVIILVNLDDEPVTDYTLDMEWGLLPGTLQAELLLGEGDVIPPEINRHRGFESYTPLESLPPQSSTLIRLNYE